MLTVDAERKASQPARPMYRDRNWNRGWGRDRLQHRHQHQWQCMLQDGTGPAPVPDVLRMGLEPPRSLSDICLKRTTFSLPQAASACIFHTAGKGPILHVNL